MNPTDDRGDSIDKIDENKDHNVEVINIEDTKNLKCHPEASNMVRWSVVTLTLSLLAPVHPGALCGDGA